MTKVLLAMTLTLSLNAMTIEEDKVQHVVVGTVVYAGCIALSKFTDIGLNAKTCLIPVIAVAVGKEIYDAQGHGTSDFNDITATLVVPFGTYVVYEW
jgi:hypothetical protein